MPTECIARLFEFAAVEGRQVVAAFEGGAITSDAGASLLGETDRAIRLTERSASCFTDARTPELVEHAIGTLVLQRVVGIALGYESLPLGRRSRTRGTSTTTTNCDTTRFWRFSQASLRRSALTARRWRASRR